MNLGIKLPSDKLAIASELGRMIGMRRRALGLTQATVANRVGLARASIANIEAGRQTLTVHHLRQIGSALGLEVMIWVRNEKK